jgi:murein DD-endopeptidase MepM/ murein hydrolase activator NlpD
MKNLLQEDISNIRRVMGLSEALGAPIETLNVSSEFNKPRKGYKHQGVDLSAPSGTNVVAIDGGTVIDAEIKNDNCGGTLYIEHPNGYKSRFCHLKQINVKKGDKVQKGQVVALSGGGKGERGAGRSTGPHLHFELYKDGSLVDPMRYINKTDYNPLQGSTTGQNSTDSSDYVSQSTFDPNVAPPKEDFGAISKIFTDTGVWKESIQEATSIRNNTGPIYSMVTGRVVDENFTDDECLDSLTIIFKYGNEIAYCTYCSVENQIVRVGENVKKGDRIGTSNDEVYAYFFDKKGDPLNLPSQENPQNDPKTLDVSMRSLEDKGKSPWLKDGPYYGNVSDVVRTFSRKINPFSSRYAMVTKRDPITGQETEKKEKVYQGGLKGIFTKTGPDNLPYLERIRYSTERPKDLPKVTPKKKKVQQKKKKVNEEIEQIKKLMK